MNWDVGLTLIPDPISPPSPISHTVSVDAKHRDRKNVSQLQAAIRLRTLLQHVSHAQITARIRTLLQHASHAQATARIRTLLQHASHAQAATRLRTLLQHVSHAQATARIRTLCYFPNVCHFTTHTCRCTEE